MQDLAVAEELDVADLEDHVEGLAETDLLDQGDGFGLLGGERGDQAGGREAGERGDEVGVEFAVDAAAVPGFFVFFFFFALGDVGTAFAATAGGRFEVEDRVSDPFLLALGGFAFAVKVPDRLGQQLGYVGAFFLQDVP